MRETVEQDALGREQAAFDAALDDLLLDHRGEFVVFKDEKAAGFFPSFVAAYNSALERFGLDQVFLVSEVARKRGQSASLTWDLAVL